MDLWRAGQTLRLDIPPVAQQHGTARAARGLASCLSDSAAVTRDQSLRHEGQRVPLAHQPRDDGERDVESDDDADLETAANVNGWE